MGKTELAIKELDGRGNALPAVFVFLSFGVND